MNTSLFSECQLLRYDPVGDTGSNEYGSLDIWTTSQTCGPASGGWRAAILLMDSPGVFLRLGALFIPSLEAIRDDFIFINVNHEFMSHFISHERQWLRRTKNR